MSISHQLGRKCSAPQLEFYWGNRNPKEYFCYAMTYLALLNTSQIPKSC